MSLTRKLILTLTGAALLVAAVSGVAGARMQSERIDPGLCQTTGGGRFVAIPGFPGEQIDRRLLRDVKRIVRRYKALITDGYSTDPVHSANGEHPIGLALDIVPDTSRGGRWRDLGRLARWAEPKQDQPRAPFRWVGYNGDAGHGRGHHLHLSWAHSTAKFGKPARTVYTSRCPKAKNPGTPPPPPAEPPSDPPPKADDGKGGVGVGAGSKSKVKDKSRGGVSFRVAKRKIRRQQASLSSRETGGVGVG